MPRRTQTLSIKPNVLKPIAPNIFRVRRSTAPHWLNLTIEGSDLAGQFHSIRYARHYEIWMKENGALDSVAVMVLAQVGTPFRVPVAGSAAVDVMWNGNLEYLDTTGGAALIGWTPHAGSFVTELEPLPVPYTWIPAVDGTNIAYLEVIGTQAALDSPMASVLPGRDYTVSFLFKADKTNSPGVGSTLFQVQYRWWNLTREYISGGVLYETEAHVPNWVQAGDVITSPAGAAYLDLQFIGVERAGVYDTGVFAVSLDAVSVTYVLPLLSPDLLYAYRAVFFNNLFGPLSEWRSPSVVPIALGDSSGVHVRQFYDTVAGGGLESSNYVPGVSGWRLDKDGLHAP